MTTTRTLTRVQHVFLNRVFNHGKWKVTKTGRRQRTVSALIRRGLVTTEPCGEALVASLTEAGRRFMETA